MIAAPHVPVLRCETLGLRAAGPGRRIVDGTFGFGGHAGGLLEAGADVLVAGSAVFGTPQAPKDYAQSIAALRAEAA